MIERFEACCNHDALGLVQVIDFHADVLQRDALLEATGVSGLRSIEYEVLVVGAEMDRESVVDRRPAPAFAPATKRGEERGGTLGIADADVDVFEAGCGPRSCPSMALM